MDTPPLRYRVLLCALSPFIVFLVLLQALKSRSKRFALQRLGFAYRTSSVQTVWIHCASVGEATAALPLVEKILEKLPAQQLLVSTTTPTGAATVARWNLANVRHQYLPVDFKFAVKKVVAAARPSVLIVMETEIWPTLINTSAAAGIPVVVVNGRIGEKTVNSPSWMRMVYLQALGKVDKILAKSETDKDRFQILGGKNIEVIGNIKFAAVSNDNEYTECEITRPFWLLASTHDDEEEQICSLLGNYPACGKKLLVIAPRHPDRSNSLQQMLKRTGHAYAVRSKAQPIDENTQVYLADQLGEMLMWFSHAEIAFMGGSLVPVGGHNVLEPAAAGVPIVCGPHLHNFSEEAELLLSAGSLLKCKTADEVLHQVDALLTDVDRCKSMGRAGRDVLVGKSDVADRYLDELLPFIDPPLVDPPLVDDSE